VEKVEDKFTNNIPSSISEISSTGLSGFELDALKEIANIGSGNASIVLSSLLNKRVDLTIPSLHVVNINQVNKEFENKKGLFVGIFSRIKQGMDGNVFIFMPTNAALKLVSLIKKKELGNKEVISEEDEQILKKLSSVISSAYITGIAKFFEENIVYSEPVILSAEANTLLDSILVRLDKKENILLVNISFDVSKDVEGDFTLVLTMSSLTPLLEKVKKKFT
jgi:chemotaxis protein CheC